MKQPDKGLGGGIHSYTIFEEIISLENIFAAWHEFSKGKRKRKDVQQFGLHAEEHLFALHDDLKSDAWRHGGYETFRVADPKPRVIHKASVRDRIVHHALVQIIEPIFERSFIFDSWSCRKGKGTHRSVVRLHRELERLSRVYHGEVWILKCDIRKFFASIDQKILLSLIEKKIRDTQTRSLIRNIIESFAHGLPLGNLTSQLFANVYMK